MCLAEIKELVESLGLALNPKTQIFPIKNGVDYLGFHIYLTETGKVVRKLRRTSKKAINSWIGHAKHGHTYHLRKHILKDAVFQRQTAIKEDN